MRTQPAQPSAGDQISLGPLPLSARSWCWSWGGEAEAICGPGGGDRTRSDPYHVCVDLDCSHQTVNSLWGEKKGGGRSEKAKSFWQKLGEGRYRTEAPSRSIELPGLRSALLGNHQEGRGRNPRAQETWSD